MSLVQFLLFDPNSLKVGGYLNPDWIRCLIDHGSTFDYCVFLDENLCVKEQRIAC